MMRKAPPLRFVVRYTSADHAPTGGLSSAWRTLLSQTLDEARAEALSHVDFVAKEEGWLIGWVTVYAVNERAEINLHEWQKAERERRDRAEYERLKRKYESSAGKESTEP